MILVQPKYALPEPWQALAEAEGLGYEILELSSPPVLGVESTQEDCFAWYAASGRVESVHGAFIDVNPASGDPLFKALSRQRCEESCDYARRLGAKRVVLHSSAFPVLRAGYIERWCEACADFYTQLARRYGVTLCIENSADLDPVPLRMLMEQVGGDEKVRICLDLGHANYSRAPMEQWFEELGSWIDAVHLSDNRGVFDDHLPLGEGSVDWQKADALWRRLGRDMPFTLEVGGLTGVEKSLAFLRAHNYFGMEG